jgi:hypothetical protein
VQIKDIHISSSYLSVIWKSIIDILQKPDSSVEVAEYLLLESADQMLCATIAIGCGSDALPGGVP